MDTRLMRTRRADRTPKTDPVMSEMRKMLPLIFLDRPVHAIPKAETDKTDKLDRKKSMLYLSSFPAFTAGTILDSSTLISAKISSGDALRCKYSCNCVFCR